jgi:hypothetical protein
MLQFAEYPTRTGLPLQALPCLPSPTLPRVIVLPFAKKPRPLCCHSPTARRSDALAKELCLRMSEVEAAVEDAEQEEASGRGGADDSTGARGGVVGRGGRGGRAWIGGRAGGLGGFLVMLLSTARCGDLRVEGRGEDGLSKLYGSRGGGRLAAWVGPAGEGRWVVASTL